MGGLEAAVEPGIDPNEGVRVGAAGACCRWCWGVEGAEEARPTPPLPVEAGAGDCPTEGCRVGGRSAAAAAGEEGGGAVVRATGEAAVVLLLLPMDVGRLPLPPPLPPRCTPPAPAPTLPARPSSMGLRRSREAGRTGRWSRRRALQCTAPSSHSGTGPSGSRASSQLNPKAGSFTLNRRWYCWPPDPRLNRGKVASNCFSVTLPPVLLLICSFGFVRMG